MLEQKPELSARFEQQQHHTWLYPVVATSIRVQVCVYILHRVQRALFQA